MGIEGIFTLLIIAVTLFLLTRASRSPDVVMVGGLTLFLTIPIPKNGVWTLGILGPSEALSGFANSGLITIAALFVVVAGLQDSGLTEKFSNIFLSRPKGELSTYFRLTLPTTILSAFINNTPVVAALIPMVEQWGKKFNIPPSKLLIPLSYSSIFGGVCTLIGTSTNLIVYGWVLEKNESYTMHLFTPALVGVPLIILGSIYLAFIGQRLLPARGGIFSVNEQDQKKYTTEMIVQQGSTMHQKSIEQAGLRQLPGLFLIEVIRNNEVIPAPSGHFTLIENDRLVFAGIVDSVKDLYQKEGLVPATDQLFNISEIKKNRQLVEVVLSDRSPMIGQTIREGKFRTHYNAAIIAVARSGERIDGKKLGDIRLRAGDTLLLEARSNFTEQNRDRSDFFLVSGVKNSAPLNHNRASRALIIFLLMILSVSFGILSMLKASLIAALCMVGLGCTNPSSARRKINWQILIVIGCALSFGTALESTGAAQSIATFFTSFIGDNPLYALIIIYLLTSFFTEIITNNAAAILMLPIAHFAAIELGVSSLPFYIAIMVAASSSFITPIGYQTNLMVYNPGGYKLKDFFVVGTPLSLLFFIGSLVLIPLVFSF